ncbi:hypothetical protein D9613_004788 [Agrocybe pediades]|uniref:Uncharacterized protein n=1 Tax=Agrocybe pediades TaxID=84607 RepID=A0A8H4QXP5_9AGAR|nr:hypothetical protein D9613_004788 [Agrocybe pediades]
MPLSKNDPFAPILHSILSDSCDPDVTFGPSARFATAEEILPHQARHVAPNLIIKHVKPAPWLTKKLALLFITKVPTIVESLLETYRSYNSVIGNQSRALACKLMFLHKSPYCVPLVNVVVAFSDEFILDGGLAVTDGITSLPRIICGDSSTAWSRAQETVPNPTIPLVKTNSVYHMSLDKTLKLLAVWNFFVPTKQAETLIRLWATPQSFGFFLHYLDTQELKHEHTIYNHIAYQNISDGIITVYGLFEDTDTGVLAILMDDAGKSLAVLNREAREEGKDVGLVSKLTPAQRNGFVNTLKALHDPSGEARIIDFERSHLGSDVTAADYQEDIEELSEILGSGSDFSAKATVTLKTNVVSGLEEDRAGARDPGYLT